MSSDALHWSNEINIRPVMKFFDNGLNNGFFSFQITDVSQTLFFLKSRFTAVYLKTVFLRCFVQFQYFVNQFFSKRFSFIFGSVLCLKLLNVFLGK